MRYEIILYWSEEDSAYIAEVPELAGCMADGATAKDALHNVEQIAQELGRGTVSPAFVFPLCFPFNG